MIFQSQPLLEDHVQLVERDFWHGGSEPGRGGHLAGVAGDSEYTTFLPLLSTNYQQSGFYKVLKWSSEVAHQLVQLSLILEPNS